jgi:hypothetical protein
MGIAILTNLLGFPFSFGVFQEYYSTHEPISSDSSGVAVIGTTATVSVRAFLCVFVLTGDRESCTR